jgi:hypothetical protein
MGAEDDHSQLLILAMRNRGASGEAGRDGPQSNLHSFSFSS